MGKPSDTRSASPGINENSSIAQIKDSNAQQNMFHCHSTAISRLIALRYKVQRAHGARMGDSTDGAIFNKCDQLV